MVKQSEGIFYKHKGIDMIAHPGDTDYKELSKMQKEGKEPEIKTKESWDIAIDKINAKLDKFPLPQKPSTFGEEYSFPQDITNITSIDLGRWMFKLAAWKGYALKMLAYAETELAIVDDLYDANLAKYLGAMEPDRLMKKEAMIGKALNSDEKLKSLKSRLVLKSGEVAGVKRITEIYTLQLEVISREISRRGMDLKLMQKAILSHE